MEEKGEGLGQSGGIKWGRKIYFYFHLFTSFILFLIFHNSFNNRRF